MNRNQRIIVFLLFLMLLISFFVYARMPATIATHWGINGQADGYSGKTFGLFFLPLFSFLLYGLLAWLPNLDPKRKNIDLFRSSYEGFMILFFLFFFYLHLLTIVWNLGMRVSFNQAFAPAIAALFYGMGFLIEKAKMNYFIGIRTPWTLANEEVWDETHKKGGIAFKICGILCLLGLVFPGYFIWIVLSTTLIAASYTIVLSYFIYKRVMKKNN
jgi:uncharacterized membrane protein